MKGTVLDPRRSLTWKKVVGSLKEGKGLASFQGQGTFGELLEKSRATMLAEATRHESEERESPVPHPGQPSQEEYMSRPPTKGPVSVAFDELARKELRCKIQVRGS